MALIGVLTLGLKANTKGFSKGMKRASATINSFKGNLRTLTTVIAGFGAALIGIKGIQSFTDAMSRIDTTKKFADRIGIATEELQKLQFAALETGVSSNTLNTSLQRMVRRIGEAATGGGPAAQALKQIGLSAESLFKLAPDKQFSLIADSLGSLNSSTEKVALAQKIFDSEGVALINTLNLQADGLKKAGDEADKLGIIISAIDSAKIEEAGDKIGRVQSVLTNIVNTLAIKLSPLITFVSEKFLEWQKVTTITNRMKASMENLAIVIDVVKTGASVVSGIFKAVSSVIQFIIGGVSRIFAALADFAGKTFEIKSLEDFAQQAESFGQSLVESGKETGASAGQSFVDAFDSATESGTGIVLRNIKLKIEKITKDANDRAEKLVSKTKKKLALGRTDEALQALKDRFAESKAGSVASSSLNGDSSNSILSRLKPVLAQAFDTSLVDIGGLSSVGKNADKVQDEQLQVQKEIARNTVTGFALLAP